MTQENDTIFSSLLKIHYDTRFISIAQGYAKDLAALAGASKRECEGLEILVGECLSFIMDKYMDCRFDAHIEMCFDLRSDKTVVMEMADIGPPINRDRIPEFDITDEASQSGLWHHLVKSLADDFSFVNRFDNGWLLRVTKALCSVSFERGTPREEGRSVSGQAAASGALISRMATPADVPALIEMAYMTYRYSYFLDFYDPERMAGEIASRARDTVILEQGGKLICAFAIQYPHDGAVSAELGSAMILPEYRTPGTVRMLMRETARYLDANPRGCDFFVSHAVTGHDRSQRMLHRVGGGFRVLSLFLGMVPKPSFIGISENTVDRETLAFVYLMKGAVQARRVYVPQRHRGISLELLANARMDREVLTDTVDGPGEGLTELEITRNGTRGFGIVDITSWGRDWEQELTRAVVSLLVSGIESIGVNFPADRPLPALLDERLLGLHLVFCGLMPRSLDAVALSYCLAVRPIDPDGIHLHDPVAKRLLEHIVSQCPERFGT